MSTQRNKQGLVDWLNELDDPAGLQNINSIKESTESVSWDDLPEQVKAGIRRGEQDIKAGRVYISEEFWKEVRLRRKQGSGEQSLSELKSLLVFG